MGHKANIKKTRQLFRREIRDTVQKLTAETFDAGELENPKPKWCPQWLWEKMVVLIINQNFKHNYEKVQQRIKEGKQPLERAGE